MKNKISIILAVIFLIVGCSKKTDRSEILFAKYESAYDELLANDKFIDKSEYYDVEVVVNKIENNKFRVDLIIDNPKIAMYNVLGIMEIDSKGVLSFDEVNPSIGLVDDSKFHLIPNQHNVAADYYEGLVLSGLSSKSSGEIIAMISWSDYAEVKVFSEFIKLPYDINNTVDQNEVVENEVEEDSEDE